MKKKTAMKKSMKASTMDEEVPMEEENEKGGCCQTQSCMCASCWTCCAGWGLLLLRVVVGVVFVYHGIWKFQNWDGALGFFSALFGSAGGFLLGLVAVVEIVAGLALIIGMWMKWAGYLLAIIMLFAVVWAKMIKAPVFGGWSSIEFDVTLLAAALALAWTGPGNWSIHSMCKCCKNKCSC